MPIERLNQLLQTALNDPDPEVRAVAVRQLSEDGAAVPQFFMDLVGKDAHPRVRAVAAGRLASSTLALADRIHWLLGFLKDRDEPVKLAAIDGLRQLRAWEHDEQVLPDLTAKAASDPSPAVRDAAAIAVVAAGPPKEPRTPRDKISEPKRNLWRWCLETLEHRPVTDDVEAYRLMQARSQVRKLLEELSGLTGASVEALFVTEAPWNVPAVAAP